MTWAFLAGVRNGSSPSHLRVKRVSAMRWIWETRYSSCEMHYVEVTPRGVHFYLHHSKDAGDWFTFEQFEAGEANGELVMYSDADRAEMLAAVRQMRRDPPATVDEQAARQRERREGMAERTKALLSTSFMVDPVDRTRFARQRARRRREG